MPYLTDSLQIMPRDAVALVGAGGKTSTVLRLAIELRELGRRLVTTTTVHMAEIHPPQPFYFLVEPDVRKILAQVPALLREYGHVRVASERQRPDKIRGVEPETVAALAALPEVDNILVEADGARHRSFKAPNEHEPVLPPKVDLLLAFAGLDIVGKPLGEEHVHRPEMVSALTGLREGDIITPDAVSKVLSSPQGGLKDLPPGARAWFVLTKWNPDNDNVARDIARLALERAPQAQGAVLLGAGHNGPIAVIHTSPEAN